MARKPGVIVGETPQPLRGLRIAHVVHSDPNYARTRITVKALERAGATVIPVHREASFRFRARAMWSALRASSVDVVMVGYLGHADVPLARLAMPRDVPVIFDPLNSLYETNVESREVVSPRSGKAVAQRLEDALAARLATLVVMDTAAHIDYFAEQVHLPLRRFRRVWVGADDDTMKPVTGLPERPGFRAFFYGNLTPFHGAETILRAARLLENAGEQVEISMVGEGQASAAVHGLAERLGVTSVRLLGRQPYDALPSMICASQVCLGIFSASPRAARVIPNKVFDYLACGAAVITADTPAAREALVHGETAWLCRPGDPSALAEAIVRLRDDEAVRRRVGEQGLALFRSDFSIAALARHFTQVVLDALGAAAR